MDTPLTLKTLIVLYVVFVAPHHWWTIPALFLWAYLWLDNVPTK